MLSNKGNCRPTSIKPRNSAFTLSLSNFLLITTYYKNFVSSSSPFHTNFTMLHRLLLINCRILNLVHSTQLCTQHTANTVQLHAFFTLLCNMHVRFIGLLFHRTSF